MGGRSHNTMIGIDDLIGIDGELRDLHARYLADGFTVASVRTWRRRDGSVSARVVWRKRGQCRTDTWSYSARYVPA